MEKTGSLLCQMICSVLALMAAVNSTQDQGEIFLQMHVRPDF